MIFIFSDTKITKKDKLTKITKRNGKIMYYTM